MKHAQLCCFTKATAVAAAAAARYQRHSPYKNTTLQMRASSLDMAILQWFVAYTINPYK